MTRSALTICGSSSQTRIRRGRGASDVLLLRSEMPAYGVNGDPASVIGGRAEDEDLRGHTVEQPTHVVVAQAYARVFIGRDDDAVEVLVLEKVAQRISGRSPAPDAGVHGDALRG